MDWKLIEDKSWSSLEQQFGWVREMNTVPQDTCYHAEGNVAVHTRMVLEALQQSAAYQSLSALEKEIVWAAALLHDVEKRSTSVDEGEGRVSAKGHARKGEYTARTILYRDCPAPFRIREQIASLVRYHGVPIWWLLVVSENPPLFGYPTACKPITCEFLFRETNPRRDKNGTEPQENKIKNALLRISVSEYLLLRCKGTNLSRKKRIKTHKVHIYSAFFIFLYHGG